MREKRRKRHTAAVTVPLGSHCEHRCPLCGGLLVLSASRYGMFYGCVNYRTSGCRGSHGAHPNGKPLGIPADERTKRLRIQAHDLFDQLWKRPDSMLSRSAAYTELARLMCLTSAECHFSLFDSDACELAIARLTEYLTEKGLLP